MKCIREIDTLSDLTEFLAFSLDLCSAPLAA